MSLTAHLDELRRRLVYGLLGLLPALLLCLWQGRTLVVWMQLPLFGVQDFLGLPRGAYFFSPISAFTIYIKVALVCSIIITLPWMLFQLWRFISEGLYPNERHSVRMVAPISAALMVLGVLFSFFVLVPISLLFLLGWSAGYPDPGDAQPALRQIIDTAGRSGAIPPPADGARPEREDVDPATVPTPTLHVPVLHRDPEAPADGEIWLVMPEGQLRTFVGGQVLSLSTSRTSPFSPLLGAGEMISFTLMVTFGVVLGFQLPLVMMLLGRIGVVTADKLKRFRRYAALACCVLAALLTPADPISMVVLAVPLYLLFEFGLLLMRRSKPPEEPVEVDSANEDRPS
ncbi:MAG: twin-arginine translocase subunit TatC [Phycisphaeraceae bacterium]|nr:twin-arginine translocase subunit TatC [Phycisphaeraceae bacterium]